MWIYIPTSVSVAVQEDSTSGLTEAQAELLSQSVTLREKSPPPRRWSAILRKERWLMLLSGLTLRPSISQRGVDKWKESWVATHANPSAKSASGWEPPIHVTSGRTSKQESKQLDLFGASLKMSPAICHWDSVRSPSAFKTWVTQLRRHSSQRRKSAHHTKEIAYSSWATVVARDYKGAYSNKGLIRKDGKIRMDALPDQAVRWRTPLATDATKIPSASLARQVDPAAKWNFRRGSHTDPRIQDGWVFREDYNHRYLNPNFCEWMMGWGIGWTFLGQTVSALLETESCLTQQHWPGTNVGRHSPNEQSDVQ